MKEINHQASVIAARTFIDYREQLPEELRMLSTYGIWRFVLFATRINATLFRIAYHNPASTALVSAAYSMEADMMGELRSSSPFNSNLFSGMTYGIDTNPLGSEMILPMYW